MNSVSAIVLALILLIAGLKSLLIRGKTSFADYSGADSIPPFTAVLSLFSSLVGGFMIFGLFQIGFEGGLTGILFGLSYLVGGFLILILLREKSLGDSNSVFALDRIIIERYGQRTLLSFLLMTSLLFTGVLAGQFLAVSLYLRVFDSTADLLIVVLLGLGLTIVYTVVKGFKAVVANDVIQAILVLGVGLIVPWALLSREGVSVGSLRFDLLENGLGGKYGPIYAILGAVFLSLTLPARIDIWSRLRLVDRKARRAVVVWFCVLVFGFYLVISGCGVLVNSNASMFPELQESPSDSIPLIAKIYLGESIASSILRAGVLLALLSSIDSYIHLVSLSLCRLLLWKDFSSETSVEGEKLKLVNSRLLAVGVVLVAIVISVLIPDIVDLLSAAFSLLGAVTPVLLLPVIARHWRFSDAVASSSLLVSLVVLIGSFPFLGKGSFVPATLVGWVVFFCGTFFVEMASRRREGRGSKGGS